MLTRKEQSLLDLLSPEAQRHGVEIVTLEIVGAKKSPTIRVYIDTARGVGFDELSSAQVWINKLMDEADPFPGAYLLEVSSPGIDRPLRTKEHFERFVGSDAVVKTSVPLDGRSSFKGVIEAVEGDDIVMECEEARIRIPLESIKRAHLKGHIDFS